MTTDKYGLHTIEYSVQGWDSIMNTDMQKLDDVIHTNIKVTLGETVQKYKMVGIFKGETKFKLAKSDTRLLPALGITLSSGNLDDEILIQRVGKVTNSGWSWNPGYPIFLSANQAGDLTQIPSGSQQVLGIAIKSDTILLNGTYDFDSLPTTTTTSSTTSTTTSTTSTTA